MYNAPRPFPARYNGRCTCGASFEAGARIYWDSSIRRATGCPACRNTVKTVAGPSVKLGSMDAAFERRADNGEIVVLKVSACDEPRPEVYVRGTDGIWRWRSGMVLAGHLDHARIASLVEGL